LDTDDRVVSFISVHGSEQGVCESVGKKEMKDVIAQKGRMLMMTII